MRFVCVVLLLLSFGCEKLESLDQLVFEKFGVSFFKGPEIVTIKRIHFEAGSLAGTEVITKGMVNRIGDGTTFLILKDEDGSLLVVLDGLDLGSRAQIVLDENVAIWGEVQSGKKGLPVLRATAVVRAEDNKL